MNIEIVKAEPQSDAKAALEALAARIGPLAAPELARLREVLDAFTIDETATASKISAVSEQLIREQKRARLLDHASRVINSSLDLEEVLNSVLDLAVDVMQAERGFLMLANDRGELELAAMHNLDRPTIESNDLRVSGSIVRRVYENGDPVFTTDAQNDPRFSSQHSIVSLNIRSIVCVPLRRKERTIGVVYLDSRVMTGVFSRNDPELLLALSNQAAMAIDNARLFKEQEMQLHEIQRLQTFQAHILSSITSGVITIDTAANVVRTFNDAAVHTFGVPAESIVGKPVTALNRLIPGFSRTIDQFATDARIGVRHELEGRHPKRGHLVVEVRVAPMDIDDNPGIAVAVTDLTTQRELERRHAEGLERSRKIEDSFSRYLAPHIVQSLMQNPDHVQMGGDRQPATILFADIRGFTALSSSMRAEKVVELLNAYLEEAVGVIFAHDGLLDKFYGDGLMAVFGPPFVREDDAARAVRAATTLLDVVKTINPRLLRPIEIGIGLATGEVVSGRIGSARRMDYTVIGDAVNLASRLQAVAPPGCIYTDEATYKRSALNWPADAMTARIKGRDNEVTIYALKT